MAEKTEFLQAIDDAILDADSLERFINGDDTQDVLTRLSARYPTIKKALKELFENGGIAGRFKTLVELQTKGVSLEDGDYALVAEDVEDKNGLYVKVSGEWAYSKYNPISEARDYIDKINSKIVIKDGNYLLALTDSLDNVYAYFDTDSNLHLVGDVYQNGELLRLDSNETDTNNNSPSISREVALAKDSIKSLTTIADYQSDKLIRRMPFGIKTDYGLVVFYHKQIAGYDGDVEGSEMWKAVVDVDEDYNLTVRSNELFQSPDEPIGIVKHPMLGRTSDGRIILMFEKRVGRFSAYIRYQCYSSDEGLTFTTPTLVTPSGLRPSENAALGTTGVILTAKNNRLIVPMYTYGQVPFAIYSDDDGDTWTYSGWVVKSGMGLAEPSISMDFDGNIIMDLRVDPSEPARFRRARAISKDNGETWQYVKLHQDLNAVGNQGVLFKDEQFGLMMQTHNNRTEKNSRNKFSISWSYDNDKTYPYTYQPYDDDWFGGYSQIIKYSNDVYFIVMEFAPFFNRVNYDESAGILVLNLKEMYKNANFNK